MTGAIQAVLAKPGSGWTPPGEKPAIWALAPESDFFSIALPETLPFGFRKLAGAKSVFLVAGKRTRKEKGICDE